MPSTKSAKKRLRQSAKGQERNRAHRGALRTRMKKMRAVIEDGGPEDGAKMLDVTYKAIDQAAARGDIKKNTAARYKSRFAKHVNEMGGKPQDG